MGRNAMYVILITMLPLGGVLAILEPLPAPEVMVDCIKFRTQDGKNVTVPPSTIGTYCLNQLLINTEHLRPQPAISNETLSYVSELFRMMIAEHDEKRQKRQATPRRVRKEIRMMTPFERQRYFQALNRLKSTWIGPGISRYDALAEVHRIAYARAHQGPAFLPWHRIYLLIMEFSLGPGIGIPYWDSRLDHYMQNPMNSILWSAEFLGNGFGPVVYGPFAGWNTRGIPLQRNIASSAILFTDEAVNIVLSQPNMDAISEPNPMPARSLEIHHNGPHTWTGGQLSQIEASAQDPIFFSHHAFVDYIWALFRARHREAIYQYPMKGPPIQAPTLVMFPFNTIRNIDAIQPHYERFYVYEPPPQACPCNSPFLECVFGRCRSRIGSQPNFGPMGPVNAAPPAGNSFRTPFQDPRTRLNMLGRGGGLLRIGRSTRNATETESERPQEVYNLESIGDGQMAHGYINSYEIDGVQDEKAWSFIPVRVTFEQHTASPQNASMETEMVFGNCQTSGSGAAKIFVQTDGLDYSGRYKDYVIVDERRDISSAVTYVGVKDPKHSSTHFIMTAYDTCGRVCAPRCNMGGIYRPCSGTFYLDNQSPKGYSPTKNEAEESVWKIDGALLAEPNSENIQIAFICETRKDYPWEF